MVYVPVLPVSDLLSMDWNLYCRIARAHHSKIPTKFTQLLVCQPDKEKEWATAFTYLRLIFRNLNSR